MNEILIVPSTHEENTYFIFRPLTEETFLEIKIRINFIKETIKTSLMLLPNETQFLRDNFFNKKLERVESILNYRWFDSERVEKTYKEVK